MRILKHVICGVGAVLLTGGAVFEAAFAQARDRAPGVETEDIGDKVRPMRATKVETGVKKVEIPAAHISMALAAYFNTCSVKLDEITVSQGLKQKNDNRLRCAKSFSPMTYQNTSLPPLGIEYDPDGKGKLWKTRRYLVNDLETEQINAVWKSADWMVKHGKRDLSFCENCLHFLVTMTFEEGGTEMKGIFPWPGNRKKDEPYDFDIQNLKINLYVSMKSNQAEDSLVMKIVDVDVKARPNVVQGFGKKLVNATELKDTVFYDLVVPKVESKLKVGLNASPLSDNFTMALRNEFIRGQNAINVIANQFDKLNIKTSQLGIDEERDALVLYVK